MSHDDSKLLPNVRPKQCRLRSGKSPDRDADLIDFGETNQALHMWSKMQMAMQTVNIHTRSYSRFSSKIMANSVTDSENNSSANYPQVVRMKSQQLENTLA